MKLSASGMDLEDKHSNEAIELETKLKEANFYFEVYETVKI